jgi:magnesium-transporting ATPase (P-type)
MSSRSEGTSAEDLIGAINAEKRRQPKGSDENRASRLFIMRYVVTAYFIVVICVLISIAVAAFKSGQWEGVPEAVTNAATSLVLPVLTLVLGYYFGREGFDK